MVQIIAVVSPRIAAGSEVKLFTSSPVLVDRTELLQNYTPDERTQAFRELAYGVIAKFVGQWEALTP